MTQQELFNIIPSYSDNQVSISWKGWKKPKSKLMGYIMIETRYASPKLFDTTTTEIPVMLWYKTDKNKGAGMGILTDKYGWVTHKVEFKDDNGKEVKYYVRITQIGRKLEHRINNWLMANVYDDLPKAQAPTTPETPTEPTTTTKQTQF